MTGFGARRPQARTCRCVCVVGRGMCHNTWPYDKVDYPDNRWSSHWFHPTCSSTAHPPLALPPPSLLPPPSPFVLRPVPFPLRPLPFQALLDTPQDKGASHPFALVKTRYALSPLQALGVVTAWQVKLVIKDPVLIKGRMLQVRG